MQAVLLAPTHDLRPAALVRKPCVLAYAWGVLGIAALLVHSLRRLLPAALEGLGADLSVLGWSVTAVWLVAMAYFEGYRGFQRGFAPRVVARATELARAPRPLHVVLAPFYCMSLFHAPRRRVIVSWALVVTITALVLVMPLVGQPARGLIDAGVVVGLGWGLAALLVRAAYGLFGGLSVPSLSTMVPEAGASNGIGRGCSSTLSISS